jgi:hypothetical protein
MENELYTSIMQLSVIICVRNRQVVDTSILFGEWLCQQHAFGAVDLTNHFLLTFPGNPCLKLMVAADD